MRPFLVALALLLVAPNAAQAQEAPAFSNGFGELASRLGDQMGEPLSPEFSSDDGDVQQLTSTGLAYWSPSHWPTWTNGVLHVALSPGGQLARWSGPDMDPPAPRPSVSDDTGVPPQTLGGSGPFGLSPYLTRVASCESHFRPDVIYGPTVGKLGEKGLFQLAPFGLLPMFFARGFTNPWNPWQQAAFATWAFAHGLGGRWSCA